MKNIDIGIKIITSRLQETRLAIQASSGGGKSYCIRKIVEELFGIVPIIILDYEDEFSSLREKYDFVLFGDEGDYPVDVRYAEKLAQTLWQMNVSAVISLYELSPDNRQLFVKGFIEGLLKVKKQYWTPLTLVIDEAHIFAPQKQRSVATEAVAGIVSRGRKRRITTILATQRIAKLDKDVTAECLNKLIGRTGQDADRQRAGDELGFTSKEAVRSLRRLKPGEFFAFGPAFPENEETDVTRFKVSKVKTSHESILKRKRVVPPPSIKVKKLLQQITDIPKEVEKEKLEIEDYRKQVNDLRVQVRELKQNDKIGQRTIGVIVDESEIKLLQDKVTLLEGNIKKISLIADERLKIINDMLTFFKTLPQEINKIFSQFNELFLSFENNLRKIESAKDNSVFSVKDIREAVKKLERDKLPIYYTENIKGSEQVIGISNPNLPVGNNKKKNDLPRCDKAILTFLASKNGLFITKSQIAVATGYSIRSSGFVNAISRLNVGNLIVKNSMGEISVNADNVDVEKFVGKVSHVPVTIEDWISKLQRCDGLILKYLYENSDIPHERIDVAEITGYSSTSSGFVNAISRLNRLHFIIKPSSDTIQLNPEIYKFIS